MAGGTPGASPTGPGGVQDISRRFSSVQDYYMSQADYARSQSVPLSAMAENTQPKIRIGICAMDKKASSKPMKAIVERLNVYNEFDIIQFGDDVILNKPPEEWPTCDSLMSWHSEGFPLDKARRYAELRLPFLINDTLAQHILLDRRQVYKKLEENGIAVPKHIIVDRDNLEAGEDPPGFEEAEEHVSIDGVRIYKPFVEKPADGEDHNINIYYPHSMGGGVKRLFRKVGDKSGDYDASHSGNVRRSGSYIYEEFLTTSGTDVKVYTVGPRYAHAEARKSPVVDGKVLRTPDGKEIRFPVLLSPVEKEIARQVSLAFRQKICGFDLLRSEGNRSYVCDVNGWSFVKNSKKYYDDAAGILRTIILSALAPHRLVVVPTPSFATIDAPDAFPGLDASASYADLKQLEVTNADHESELQHTDDLSQHEELRCLLAIIRHGDRTPKQKMKLRVTQQPLLDLFMKHKDSKNKQAKLKSPIQLQELLDITRALLKDMEREAGAVVAGGPIATSEEQVDSANEVRERFRIVRTVLEQGGHFSGINRKVQLKPLAWGKDPDTGALRVTEVLLILKHGGVLTHAGRQQAEGLGSVFRTVMYPRVGPQGGGLLRLHSTYRHDLKIYSSDEGRVQASAAAFTKGFLDLEGTSLTPILVSLVNKDATMLDAFGKGASDEIMRVKDALYHSLTFDAKDSTAAYQPLQTHSAAPSPPRSPLHTSPPPSVAPATQPTDGTPKEASEGNEPGPALRVSLPSEASLPSECGASASTPTAGKDPEGRDIPGMPDEPLALLHQLAALMKVFVDSLREKCLEGKSHKAPPTSSKEAYSALNQDPSDWSLDGEAPCGGERLLLMFDRWRKLLKSFWSTKKAQFDISKVPDIYDSVKYDAIHNQHLGMDMSRLYATAKVLADAVIPNEYGTSPQSKLRIGSKIATQLVGKLLQDLENMRQESLATAAPEVEEDPFEFCAPAAMTPHPPLSGQQGCGASTSSKDGKTGREVHGTETDQDDDDVGEETIHRLAASYADDVNSPLRHVRTRIYFTSESHIHSLINVLRFAHLDGVGEATEAGGPSLLGDEALAMLLQQTEFDYLTQIIFRLYERKHVAVDSPDRFRVELSFSPGACHKPLAVSPVMPHVLPTLPRQHVHRGEGVTLARLYELLAGHSTPRKGATESYHHAYGGQMVQPSASRCNSCSESVASEAHR